MARRLLLAMFLLLVAVPSAHAVDPEDTVSGVAGSKWFSGSLIQQTGLNCSTAVLGSAYSEVMVSGIGSYGGLAAVPRVNQGYWTSLLLSIPGNPCGPGSASVNTDLVLPPNTAYDNTRPIRCFGQARAASTFEEISSQTWSFAGSTGPYCPLGAATSGLHAGALSFGFRPLASGQLFEIFVPVKSSAPLIGAANTPADGFRWLTDASGVYENPGLSTVWANVFAGAGGGTPSVFFSREPSVVPFWKPDAPTTPADARNRIELWVNVYTAGLAGSLCFEIRRVSDNTLRADCTIDGGPYSVAAGFDTAQLNPVDAVHTGPNGGYVPLWFDGPDKPDPEWNQDMRITWKFTPTGGAAVTKSIDFHTLAGPDADGDGVADAVDSCVGVKGTLANGCMPAVQGDVDGDGAFGANDLCPTISGNGSTDGCPAAVVPPVVLPPVAVTPPPVVATPIALKGAIGLRRLARLRRSLLLTTGATVPVTCSVASKATTTLTVTRAVAKRLGIRTARPTLVIGTATGACGAARGATLRVKYLRSYTPALKRYTKPFVAQLSLTLITPRAHVATRPLDVKVS